MRFTWDEYKNRGNLRKHGISFDTAARIFLDPLHVSRQDRTVDGEDAWLPEMEICSLWWPTP